MTRNWNKYFLSICATVAQRSTCLNYQVGCVITRDNHIISTGYNGVPSNQEHCIDKGYCTIPGSTCGDGRGSLAIHAEKNAIGWLASQGIATKGSILYCTHEPCKSCKEIIIAAQIKKVITPYGECNHFNLLNKLN